ncbi:hypothetical protein EXS57_01875 [Candidatus Kaiserbacteria bacterium]|nr:hypothetical protein [Candidatus Kaiserbacteria bacterium]
MRTTILSFILVLVFSYGISAQAQSTNTVFTENLSLGSSGVQVTALQKILNQDPETRIATTGPGSPGNETNRFGPLTKTAVIRFQEKYASEVLAPAGLTKGTGRVGSYTRAKLNTFSTLSVDTKTTITTSSTPPSLQTLRTPKSSPLSEYLVKESEKIDIYVGDKMVANVKNKIANAVNTGIARVASLRASPTALSSTTSITLPAIQATDFPSATIGSPTPRSALPGTPVSIKGSGIGANSVVYFGSNYIVRNILSGSSADSFIVTVPPVPPGLYDIVVKTSGTVSNTTLFVVVDPKNKKTVSIKNVSPTVIAYGGTLTITGTGFSPQKNIVITKDQKITNIPSPDGTTLVVQLAPESLKEYAKIGSGVEVPVSVYVANEYGFSAEKSFSMRL